MLAGRRWSVPDDLIASRCTEFECGGRMKVHVRVEGGAFD
jgi:hypothetical protein